MTEILWYEQAAFPVLAAMQLLPLLAAGLLVALSPWRGAAHLGRLVTVAELALAIYLYRCFEAGREGFQLAERLGFFGPFNYHAAADWVTVLFVLLAAFLVAVISLYGLLQGAAKQVRFMALVLAIEAAVMAALTTLNLFWFVVALAVEAALVGALLWQGLAPSARGRLQARFFQFQGTGLLLLMLGALLVGWNHASASGGGWSFDLLDLAEAPVPEYLGSIIFFLLFYGLAIRTPIFPMHGWLPTLAHQANAAVVPTLLLGIKIGLYGMVRFLMQVVPEAVIEWHWFVAGFAAVGVFYAVLQAFLQTDLRRLLAFVVIGHAGLLVIGLFSLRPAALSGSMLLAAIFGLAMAVLLVMTGFIQRRTRTTRLQLLGGLFRRMPVVAITFLAGGLAIFGLLGAAGLDAAPRAAMAAMKTFGAYPVMAVVLGNAIASGFLLYAFLRAVLAPPPIGAVASMHKGVQSLEYLVAGLLLLALLGAAFYLAPWQALVQTSMHPLAVRF